MTDRELIDRLRKEAEEHTPSVSVDPRAVRLEGTKGHADVLVRSRKPLYAALAGFLVLVLLLAVLLPLMLRGGGTDLATLVISINPSAEFTLEDGKVTKTRPLNRDAAVLLNGTDFGGKTAEDACLEFARLAEKNHLIGTDGVRIRVTGKNGDKIAQGVHGVLDTLFSVSDLGDADFENLFSGYDEEAMERFEDYVMNEYGEMKQQYLAEARRLFETYKTDLLAIDLTDRAEVEEFNRTYLKLGEDFLIETDDDDSPREILEELLEEYDEIMRLLEADEDEAFEELFDGFMDLVEESFDDDD